MAVHIDVDTQFNRPSIERTAEETKRYFANVGDDAGRGFADNFARAVEHDTNVRKAAEKIGDSLDSVTAAEARRATQLEKSKAINEAVAASEAKLSQQRSQGSTEAAAATERELTTLREKQSEINNRLIVSTTAVSRAERDRTRAIREAGEAYRKMGEDADAASSRIESAFSRIGKFGDKHGGGAIPMNIGLTGIGLLPAAATAITEVAGAVQQLAGAGLALPGIFAGVASSVGVGALGMHGMSDAIKAVNKASDGTQASVDAANKALGALSPTGADVAKTVVGLKGTFLDLRNIASENMLAGFSTGLKGLVAADLPAVTRGIDGISRGINQNLRQAMTSLGSGSSQGFLDRIFGNTAGAQSKLTAAIDPMVHAIGTLTAAGSDTLPRLADAIGNAANRFDKFITAADGDGRLKRWIDDGITGFGHLAETALNIGKTFTALTQAAGGGAGLLGTLDSATGRLQTFLNSTEGQSKLRDFFAQGRDMLGQLKDVATSAGPVLAGVFNAGITAANIWLPVIKQVLDLINAIPGGAGAAVNAFIAWKTISGVASLASALGGIEKVLKIALPAAATESAAAITAAFARITLPAWLAGLIFGGMPDSWRKWMEEHPIGGIFNPMGGAIGGGPGPIGGFFNPMGGAQGGAPPAPSPGQPGQPGPSGATGPGWFPAPSTSTPKLGSTIGVSGSAVGVPGVSSYSPPTVTSGSGGTSKTPFIDPSKYLMGDPLARMPAAVPGSDPQKVFEADSKVISDTHNLEQQRLALQVLEKQGNATQEQLLTAKNNIQEQERALYDAQAKDIAARTGQMKQATSDLTSGMGDIGAALDKDLGISKGLAGMADNLVRFLANLAFAPMFGQLSAISAASPSKGGFGLMGIMGAQGAFGPEFTGLPQQGGTQGGHGSSALGPAGLQPGYGGYTSDAALLANVPAGRYTQTQGADLTKGLADCSSAVEDLVNLMDNRPTGGRSMSTGNAAEWLTSHGFQPGSMPGAFNVGFNNEHMQATLPGGTPFNWGSDAAAARGGVGGTGAFDPAFTSHYYRPVGGGGVGSPTTGSGGGYESSGGGSFGGGSIPIPLPVTIVGGSGAGPIPVGGAGAPGSPPPAGGGGGAPQWHADWNAVAQGESGGNWGTNTGNGYSGGLQFSPSSWQAAGGTQYAPSANLATPYQQAMTAEQLLAMQGPGAWPHTFVPGSSGPGPLPSIIPGAGGGQGYLGLGGPSLGVGADVGSPGVGSAVGAGGSPDLTFGGMGLPPGTPGVPRPGGFNPYNILSGSGSGVGTKAGLGIGSPPPGAGGPTGGPAAGPTQIGAAVPPPSGSGKGGVGIAEGGSIDTAMGLAASAFPGVGQAAQTGMKLASRAIQFGSQAAGIAVQGAMQTFLPMGGSELANNSWFTKILGGIAGAAPALPNMAGKPAAPPAQQPGQPGQGQGQPPGPPQITVNNQRATEDGTGRDVAFHMQNMYAPAGQP